MSNAKKDHNYVETPKEIIDFIRKSVEEISLQEFGKKLSDADVKIIDPFAGEGQFFNGWESIDGDSTKEQYEIDYTRFQKAKKQDKKIRNCKTYHVDTLRDK